MKSAISDGGTPPAALLGLGLVLLCLHVAMGQSPKEGDTQNEAQLEYNVKLAYLCKLGAYVTWPDASRSPGVDTWIIGTLGGDPFGGELDRIVASGRKVNGRKIVARHFASVEKYQSCHILFVAKTVPPEQWAIAIRALRGKHVLVVGEANGFAVAGGCINFYREQENIRFEINHAAVRGQELQISSKLLALAKLVQPTPAEH